MSGRSVGGRWVRTGHDVKKRKQAPRSHTEMYLYMYMYVYIHVHVYINIVRKAERCTHT